MKTDTIVTIAAVGSVTTAGAMLFIALKAALLAGKASDTLDVIKKHAPHIPKVGAKKGESEIDQICRVSKDVCAFKKEMNTAMNVVKKIW